ILRNALAVGAVVGRQAVADPARPLESRVAGPELDLEDYHLVLPVLEEVAAAGVLLCGHPLRPVVIAAVQVDSHGAVHGGEALGVGLVEVRRRAATRLELDPQQCPLATALGGRLDHRHDVADLRVLEPALGGGSGHRSRAYPAARVSPVAERM